MDFGSALSLESEPSRLAPQNTWRLLQTPLSPRLRKSQGCSQAPPAVGAGWGSERFLPFVLRAGGHLPSGVPVPAAIEKTLEVGGRNPKP